MMLDTKDATGEIGAANRRVAAHGWRRSPTPTVMREGAGKVALLASPLSWSTN
jgi:hypothetical protein